MKRALVGIVVVVGIALAAVLALPLIYDVDKKLRPEIEKLAQQKLNGSLQLGSMKLSMWGNLKVSVAGVKLSQAENTVLSTDQASLSISYISLLGGELKAQLILEQPKISVQKQKDGSFNLMQLVKAESASNTAPDTPESEAGSAADLSVLERLDFDLIIREAELTYLDVGNKSEMKVTGLDLELENLGVDREIELESKAKIEFRPNKDLSLLGDLLLDGKTRLRWTKTGFQGLSLDLDLDLKDLDIQAFDLLTKGPGIPLEMETKLQLYPDRLEIEKIKLEVNDFELTTSGSLVSFSPLKFDLRTQSNRLELNNWQKILRPVGQFSLQGKLDLDLRVSGSLEALEYKGSLNLSEGGMLMAGLKNPLRNIRAEMLLQNQKLELKQLAVESGASRVDIKGVLRDFSAPNLRLLVTSKSMKTSDWLAPMTEQEKQQKIAQAKGNQPGLSQEEIRQMLMGPIEQLKQIPLLRKAQMQAQLKIDRIEHEAIRADNFVSKLSYQNLAFELEEASMDLFAGKAVMTSRVDIQPKLPKYSMRIKAAGLDVVDASQAFVPAMKGSLTGKLDANFKLSGQGIERQDLEEHLMANGDFQLIEGSWSGMQAMKLLGEKLAKVPGVKDKAANIKMGNEFSKFFGEFGLAKGIFVLHQFQIDLKEARTALMGQGTVNFDLLANLKASVIAPAGNVPKKLRYKDGRMQIPVDISGPIKEPKVDWDKTLKLVAGAYAEEAGARVIEAEKKKLGNKLEQDAKKLLKGKDAKKLLKGLGL